MPITWRAQGTPNPQLPTQAQGRQLLQRLPVENLPRVRTVQLRVPQEGSTSLPPGRSPGFWCQDELIVRGDEQRGIFVNSRLASP